MALRKAYIQVYNNAGLLWPGSAVLPASEASRLTFDNQYAGHKGFDPSYKKLAKYEGGDKIEGNKWLPVQTSSMLTRWGSNVEIHFGNPDKDDEVAATAVTVGKHIRVAGGNNNPVNIALAETMSGHSQISGEGDFVYKLTFLAAISEASGDEAVTMVTPAAVWFDSCLDDENIAGIFTPKNAGTSVDTMGEFAEIWNSVSGGK